MKQERHNGTTRGFSRASGLMQSRIRKASEGRGFAETRLLTHWAEIVGDQTAKMARPIKISYAQAGMGATLTVLTTGAVAPMLEMQKTQIIDRVNACYGYRAISRLRITQTAPTGFHEGRADFGHAPAAPKEPTPAEQTAAHDMAAGLKDNELRQALAALGANVLSKRKL